MKIGVAGGVCGGATKRRIVNSENAFCVVERSRLSNETRHEA